MSDAQPVAQGRIPLCAGALRLFAVAFLTACTHMPAPATIDADLAIVGATVIDPRDGSRMPARTVLIARDSVVSIGAEGSLAVPARAQIVDGHGKYLIPGLWDMHVHALWDPIVRDTFLPVLTAHGVIGVRDMGGTTDVMRQVRSERNAAQARGADVPWPRIVAPGPILDGPAPVDPSISRAIATAAEANDAVAELDALDVDFIKVYTLLPPEAYREVVAEAARRGLPVAGHIPHGIDAIEATSGMRSIEHLRAETGGLCAGMPAKHCETLLEACRDRHVWQTPTLAPLRARAYIDAPALSQASELAYLPESLLSIWRSNRDRSLRRLDADGLDARRADFARGKAMVATMEAYGIPLLAGSDAGADWVVPGVGLHQELELLVEAGLTPHRVLRMATTDAAVYLGLHDHGWIGAGSAADLILLDADPLTDIRNTRRIASMILRGRLLDRGQLDALLEHARLAAAAHRD